MHLLLAIALFVGQQAAANPERLWNAAKSGDKAGVEKALAAGVRRDHDAHVLRKGLLRPGAGVEVHSAV